MLPLYDQNIPRIAYVASLLFYLDGGKVFSVSFFLIAFDASFILEDFIIFFRCFTE